MNSYNVETTENNDLVLNVANCINDKMSMLNINLSQLASDAEVDYYTLRKIVHQNQNYLPNTRILIKIAKYLNIKVGDLLSYHGLPQYIPIITLNQINDFFNGKVETFGFRNTILAPKFVHKNAFAIKQLSMDLLTPANIVYTCYPSFNKSIVVGQVYLMEIYNNSIKNFVFGRVIDVNNDSLEIIMENQKTLLDKYKIIAIVVNMQMSEILI